MVGVGHIAWQGGRTLGRKYKHRKAMLRCAYDSPPMDSLLLRAAAVGRVWLGRLAHRPTQHPRVVGGPRLGKRWLWQRWAWWISGGLVGAAACLCLAGLGGWRLHCQRCCGVCGVVGGSGLRSRRNPEKRFAQDGNRAGQALGDVSASETCSAVLRLSLSTATQRHDQ
jgi:hypothetical protein